MERIERLAALNPRTEQVNGHALEMFRLLRAFAMLDWVLQHPNDLGEKKSIAKYEALMGKCWKLMSTMQDELERPKPQPKLVELVGG